MFLTLENPERLAVFLSKGNSILMGTQCARPSYFFSKWFSYKTYRASSIHLNGTNFAQM
jgi:hypothetical protein